MKDLSNENTISDFTLLTTMFHEEILLSNPELGFFIDLNRYLRYEDYLEKREALKE
jgi:hypothetical protein